MAVIRLPYLRITNGFDKLFEGRLVDRANQIIAAMTNNPNFLTPDPALLDITAAVNAYQAAVAAAKLGAKYERDVRDDKRNTLINMLHLLANYVIYESRLDPVKAQSSSYNIAQPPTPSDPVTKPINVLIADGANKGEMAVSFDKVATARSYQYECAKDPLTPNTQWETQVGTVRKALFKGLDSGATYNVRIAAVGIDGQQVYSDVVRWMVR